MPWFILSPNFHLYLYNRLRPSISSSHSMLPNMYNIGVVTNDSDTVECLKIGAINIQIINHPGRIY